MSLPVPALKANFAKSEIPKESSHSNINSVSHDGVARDKRNPEPSPVERNSNYSLYSRSAESLQVRKKKCPHKVIMPLNCRIEVLRVQSCLVTQGYHRREVMLKLFCKMITQDLLIKYKAMVLNIEIITVLARIIMIQLGYRIIVHLLKLLELQVMTLLYTVMTTNTGQDIL